jgi:hypothetical protein
MLIGHTIQNLVASPLPKVLKTQQKSAENHPDISQPLAAPTRQRPQLPARLHLDRIDRPSLRQVRFRQRQPSLSPGNSSHFL